MPEFDTLIKVLEEDRPAIDPAFARELDQRAADGFAKPPRSRRLRLPSVSMRLGPPMAGLASLVLVVAVIAGLAGSTNGGDDELSSGASSSSSSTAAKPAPAAEQSSASRNSVAVPPMVPGDSGGARNRAQELTAGLTLVAPAKEVADVGDRIVGVADQVGGFVVSSNVRATDGTTGGGDFTLRVPVARLDDALARLSRLANVRERTQGSQDITAERNLARERLQEAAAERRSLLKRLGAATTDNQVASLKGRLADVNAAIASSKGALRQVERRAQFASVQVTLAARSAAVAPVDDGRWTPGDAVGDAGRVLEVVAGVLVIVASVLVPLALLGLLFLLGQRVAGRRGRSRVLETV